MAGLNEYGVQNLYNVNNPVYWNLNSVDTGSTQLLNPSRTIKLSDEGMFLRKQK